ncbi:unnamed protein product [Cuscuta campestris]|uniref:CCHC-type domain-containing protein n=1 Tax=Cuscuta campestris TaxID=132261 RepID=A0A484MU64_9ASTE|nr:unnamed protein product [Cuscuta campestris]
MKYWSLTGLSKIGSLVGKPIKRDRPTANKTKYAYARIQVEVKVQQEFPMMVSFIDDEERVRNQQIRYEWYPCMCSQCGKLGHVQESCRKKGNKPHEVRRKLVWKPKQGEVEKDPASEIAKEPETEMENKKGAPEIALEEEFKVVTGKKAGKPKMVESSEGSGIEALMRVMENAPYTGHYPFLT